MRTKIIELLKNENIEYEEIIKEAGEVLKAGGVVAFPTETVYGLGANALDEKAAQKIYEAKGRPSDNPLIVHVADVDSVYEVAEELEEKTVSVMKHFWPGPITMVLKKKAVVPLGTTGGLETIAVRMPKHELARDIIRAGGGFIAAPSANLSGRPSPTKGEHVAQDMDGRIDMVVVQDNVDIGVESTILDMTVNPPIILRPGAITKQMLEECIGDVDVDKASEDNDATLVPRAPGMKYRHYAPKASLTILEGDIVSRVRYIEEYIGQNSKAPPMLGIITTEEEKEKYPQGSNFLIFSLGSRLDEAEIASNLYSVLRAFDTTDVEHIFSESFWDGTMSAAIMNRLNKAAGYKVIKLSAASKIDK